MTMVTISAASVFGRSPECLRWMEAQGADWHDVYEVLIDSDAKTLTIHRYTRRSDGYRYWTNGEPEKQPPETLPLRSLPDPLDLLVALEREARLRERRIAEHEA